MDRPCRSYRAIAPLLLLGLLGATSSSAAAQERAPLAPQWELRLGTELAPSFGAGVGGGLNIRAGWYTRVGIDAGSAVVQRDDAPVAQHRLGATWRFLLDPYAQSPRAWYGGAGVGLRVTGEGSSRGELLLVAGFEGDPSKRRLVPALEVTLGGGVRAQLVLRRRREVGR